MRDRVWVQIRSWHALRDLTRTMCGRRVLDGTSSVDTLPAGKSCETCLRIVARQDDDE